MLTRVTHILPLTHIQRRRTLPLNGRVLVRTGQKVNANDVVADARMPREHLLIDVARGLGLSPERADQVIQRKAGESIDEGDIIAGPVGIISRVMRSPKGGRIVAVGQGRILIELHGPNLELRAGLSGTVTDLIAERGAVIAADGALIQGVWGNDRIDAGLLTLLLRAPDDELTEDRMDVSMRGGVALAGWCQHAEALKTANEIRLRALILSSITPELVPVAAQATIPIMLLEGFGKIPLNPLTYKILTTSEKREVCVNAAAFSRINGSRPELVIPLPSSGQIPAPREIDHYAPGQTVRVTQAPLQGKVVTIASLRPGLTAFPSGIRSAAAIVRQESGEQALVPLANLEIIE